MGTKKGQKRKTARRAYLAKLRGENRKNFFYRLGEQLEKLWR